jgi:hypothetical protein
MTVRINGRGWGTGTGGTGARRAAAPPKPVEELRIEERQVPLRAIRVLAPEHLAGDEPGPDALVTRRALVDIDGEHCSVTDRFWKSLFARYRFSASTFRYFRPEEVFQRVCEVSKNDRLRVMLERRGNNPAAALGVSRPDQPVVPLAAIQDLAAARGATRIDYSAGRVACSFTPRSGERALAIGPDEFTNRFELEVPIDGFGNARIHVALLRLVCRNGLIAYHRAFSSELPAGKDPLHTTERAVACFDHADGYSAIRERFLSAQTSWASVREARGLERKIGKLTGVPSGRRAGLLEDFDRLTGRINQFYGLTNVDTLPVRRQRLLPVKCRVYDLLNFAGEVATHATGPEDARSLQAWLGTTLAEEFDLEGTAESVGEFGDLFLREGGKKSR